MPASDYQKSDLVWECLKRNNCFTKKFNGIVLTRDPLNLAKVPTKKFTGLTGNGVGIELAGRKIYAVKRNQKVRNPKKNIEKIRVGGTNPKTTAKLVRFLGSSRPDLIHAVQEKVAVLSKQSQCGMEE